MDKNQKKRLKNQRLKIKKLNLRPSLKKNLLIPKVNHELYLGRCGFKNIVGLDEVGRGSWAGPLVACAVKLPQNKRFYKLRDSKLLSFLEREKLAKLIKRFCAFAIGEVTVKELNQMNLHQANLLAYERAIKVLERKLARYSSSTEKQSREVQFDRFSTFRKYPGQAGLNDKDTVKSMIDFLLIDGFRAPNLNYPQKAICSGDRVCASIAAASIVAKVYRDELMAKLACKYKDWGFEKHKGYGTSFHQKMLKKLGPLDIHRLRFAPIRALNK